MPQPDSTPENANGVNARGDPCVATRLWIESPRSAYFVGICGSGMKALAEVFLDRGWQVTGSDTQANGPIGEILRCRGARVFATHAAAQIPVGVDLLVYSSAVPQENAERTWAESHGVPQFPYHEILGELMHHQVGISISGTHGKSTTTAMTGCILTSAGLAPTVIVGAEVCGKQANGWSGTGRHLVAESCEYRRHFLSLRPQLATILGIEADHFDCFAGVDETANAFREFAQLIPADGLLVIHRDCAASQFAVQDATCVVETFAMEGKRPPLEGNAESRRIASASPDFSRAVRNTQDEKAALPATWLAINLQKTALGHQFRILHQGQPFCAVQLPIPGRHHVLNTLAAVALCYRAGASAEQIAAGIAQFKGIRRRFEVLGEWRGVTMVDDYAHHPTAIRATLKTAREQYPGRRIVCVFQPHQVSRTLGLLDDFSTSFFDADDVLLVPVYGARESFESELSDVSQQLADLISSQGVSARFHSSLDQTWTSLEDTLRPRDVLLTLGAGDIDRIHVRPRTV